MLVAFLFKLPRMLKPKMSIENPRNTNPEPSLSNGQFFAKYDLKRVSSETIKKRPIVLVMK